MAKREKYNPCHPPCSLSMARLWVQRNSSRKYSIRFNCRHLFGSEDKLRELWANPITRRELLERLEDEGCSKSDLLKLQEMIDAEDSDLFDVLEYISYARNPITRRERVSKAEDNIYAS